MIPGMNQSSGSQGRAPADLTLYECFHQLSCCLADDIKILFHYSLHAITQLLVCERKRNPQIFGDHGVELRMIVWRAGFGDDVTPSDISYLVLVSGLLDVYL